MPTGRPRLYETPEEMEPAIEAYFTECDEGDRPYTVPGLARALGFADKQSLIDYAGRAEFSFTIKAAKARIEEQRAEALVTRQSGHVGLIFDLKNNFGWKDQQDIDVKSDGKAINLWGKGSE